MRPAAKAVETWAERAAAASDDFLRGSEETTRDQAALAIAAIPVMRTEFNLAVDRGRVARGLQRAGRAGWLAGIREKGVNNFSTGVMTPRARQLYVENSGRFDAARGAAAALPRGPKGSPQNIARVTAVVNALRAARVG